MKVWKSFSCEHSAKLRIVGHFKTEEKAQRAADFFNALLEVKDKTKGGNEYFSDELSSLFETFNFNMFTENDPEQSDYFCPLEVNGKDIEILTDEVEIQALIKVLINYGAKIELYSRHEY